MELKMYSVRDSKGNFYGSIMLCHTHGEAERHLDRLVKTPDSQVAQYPADYDLYYLGSFNNVNGVITPLQHPEHLMAASAIKTSPRASQAQLEGIPLNLHQ